MSEQFRTGKVEKRYWAVVEKAPQPKHGRCVDRLVRADRQRKVRVVGQHDGPEEGQDAALEYRTLRVLPFGALVEVLLLTGRKHQIRAQLASRGWWIVGDKKYGAKSRFPLGIALHGRSLTLEHPVSHETLEIVAPLPATWQVLGVDP